MCTYVSACPSGGIKWSACRWLLVCVKCWQNKTAADGLDKSTSSSQQVPITSTAVAPLIGQFRPPSERPLTEKLVNGRPPTEAVRQLRQHPLQARQPVVDEFRRPNPDDLVLGFRRHRMMSQQQQPSIRQASLTAASVHSLVQVVSRLE